ASEQGIELRFGKPAETKSAPTLPSRPAAGFHQNGSLRQPYGFGPYVPEDAQNPNLYMTLGMRTIGVPDVPTVTDAVQWFQPGAIGGEMAFIAPMPVWQAGNGALLPFAIDNYISSGELNANEKADLPVINIADINQGDSPSTRLSIIVTQGSPTRQATGFTIGTVTARNEATFKLPLGFVATAGSVTGTGEFALIAGMNVPKRTGQIVVVSLGGTSDGTKFKEKPYKWWGGALDNTKPGFYSQGNYAFMKVIGTLDLPANMKAPSAISVTTGMNHLRGVKWKDNHINGFLEVNSPLADNLPLMQPGGEDYEKYPKGAAAVVTSMSEGTVGFIDLGPLFKYTNDMYLGNKAKNLETRNVGFSPDQWPYQLTAANIPKLVKVVTLEPGDQPVAAWTSATYNHNSRNDVKDEFTPNRSPYNKLADPHYPLAGVATRKGKLYLYSLGRYAPGEKLTDPEPSDITRVGVVTGLGDNVTYINRSKGHPSIADDALNTAITVVDRANRKINLVKLRTSQDGKRVTGTVETVIHDSRIDPIFANEATNYHTTWNTYTVGDYSGYGVHNYRFGPLIYGGNAVWSPAALLSPKGEHMGFLKLPSKPFSGFQGNVP
ncbi:MAG: hypothetical protein WKF61_11390, partial [Luteimonas sp.]